MINMRRSSAKSVAKIINRQQRGGPWGGPKKGQRMATCKSCGATMTWAKTTAGRIIPMDALPTPEGTWYYASAGMVRFVPLEGRTAGLELYTSHFATCPFADKHRREK